jgi:lysyl-tRNA synthetase class 2
MTFTKGPWLSVAAPAAQAPKFSACKFSAPNRREPGLAPPPSRIRPAFPPEDARHDRFPRPHGRPPARHEAPPPQLLVARNLILVAHCAAGSPRARLPSRPTLPPLQAAPWSTRRILQAFATPAIGPTAPRAPSTSTPRRSSPSRSYLAAGETALFLLRPCSGATASAAPPCNHPEFYNARMVPRREPYEALMEDCAASCVWRREPGARLCAPRPTCDPFRRAERLSVPRPSSARGHRPPRHAPPDGTPDAGALRGRRPPDLRMAPDDTWSDMLSKVLTHRV